MIDYLSVFLFITFNPIGPVSTFPVPVFHEGIYCCCFSLCTFVLLVNISIVGACDIQIYAFSLSLLLLLTVSLFVYLRQICSISLLLLLLLPNSLFHICCILLLPLFPFLFILLLSLICICLLSLICFNLYPGSFIWF